MKEIRNTSLIFLIMMIASVSLVTSAVPITPLDKIFANGFDPTSSIVIDLDDGTLTLYDCNLLAFDVNDHTNPSRPNKYYFSCDNNITDIVYGAGNKSIIYINDLGEFHCDVRDFLLNSPTDFYLDLHCK